LPISLKISFPKRVWLNVVGDIKTAGGRILKIFAAINTFAGYEKLKED
jgi:hypothetical protein